MNWEAIGAVGELLGAIAVLVTLVYLAVQVRHARAETRLALSQGRLEHNRELLLHQMGESLAPRVKADAALGRKHPGAVASLIEQTGLTPEQAMGLFLEEVVAWNYRVHVIAHADELPPVERDLFDGATYGRYGTTGVSAFFWEHHFKHVGHPQVIAYIERLLAEPRYRDRYSGVGFLRTSRQPGSSTPA